jgi:hypothetical protein
MAPSTAKGAWFRAVPRSLSPVQLPLRQFHRLLNPTTAEPLLDDEEDVPLATLTTDTAAAIEQLRVDARAAAEASRAPSTERAYAADWRDFAAFAARIGRPRQPAEPETVALYEEKTRNGI